MPRANATVTRAFVRWSYVPNERREAIIEVLRADAEAIRLSSKGEADDNIARDMHAAADALEAAGNLAIATSALRNMRFAPNVPPQREVPL